MKRTANRKPCLTIRLSQLGDNRELITRTFHATTSQPMFMFGVGGTPEQALRELWHEFAHQSGRMRALPDTKFNKNGLLIKREFEDLAKAGLK